MSVTEWARSEVEIALKRQKELIDADTETSNSEDRFSLTEQCYHSALDAYTALASCDHSGYSWARAAEILKRLLDEKPLTPITDVAEEWNLVTDVGGIELYQCRRCHSLFKEKDRKTGKVSYHDNNRFVCYDERGIKYHNGFISSKLHNLYPITMPYMPTTPSYTVEANDFSSKGLIDEFDTIEIKRITEPDGTTVVLNWYYKEAEEGWVGISYEEFCERRRSCIEHQVVHEPK